MTKQQAQAILEQMPEGFTADQLYDKLILIESVKLGLQAIEQGQVVGLEEARARAKTWVR